MLPHLSHQQLRRSGVSTPPGRLAEDGQFGPKTYAGLRIAQAYEKAVGPSISVDGQYGPETRNALRWRGTYINPNGNPISTCARVKTPLTIVGSTPPTTPAPQPVTRRAEVASSYVIADAFEEPFLRDDVFGYVEGTRNASRTAVTINYGFALRNGFDTVAEAFFELLVYECVNGQPVYDGTLNGYPWLKPDHVISFARHVIDEGIVPSRNWTKTVELEPAKLYYIVLWGDGHAIDDGPTIDTRVLFSAYPEAGYGIPQWFPRIGCF